MFEQTLKNIDDILHKDAGCGSELDYVEQTSRVLFLKYLDDLEKDKATAAEPSGNASISLRKLLLENCNLHTVLDLPGGTFTGAGVKTVVLFFEKGAPTQKVWFYQLNLDRNLGKTNTLNERDLADFVALQKTFADSENFWTLNVASIDTATYDLSTKNPNKKGETALRQPQGIQEEMRALEEESAEILNSILELI